MNKPLETFKYMRAFRCIGPDCEDHCCRGWRINLDEPDFRRLEGLREQSQRVDSRFEQAVKRDSTDPAEKNYAHLVFNQCGSCYFEEAGLCAIHRDFGEKALPKTCATYPRKTVVYEDRRELSGFLSCPEVARLCLLHEDAMERVVVSDDLLPFRIDELDYRVVKGDFYCGSLPLVREAVLALLGRRTQMPEANIYLVLYLARKLEPFFSRGMTADPQPRLKRVLARMMDSAFQENILGHRHHGVEHAPIIAEFLMLVLKARDNHANRSRYKDFVGRVLVSYGFEDLKQSQVQALWQVYQERQERLRARFGERVNRFLHHYSLNLWYQEQLVASDNLSVPARRFVLGFAVMKFLLCGHPDLADVLAMEADDPLALALLDRIAVEAVQVFSKNISHNNNMLIYLSEAMVANGLADVASLGALIH